MVSGWGLYIDFPLSFGMDGMGWDGLCLGWSVLGIGNSYSLGSIMRYDGMGLLWAGLVRQGKARQGKAKIG